MAETDWDLKLRFTMISPTQREKTKTEEQGEVISLKPKNQFVTDAAGAQRFWHSLNKEVLGKVFVYSKAGDREKRSNFMQKPNCFVFICKITEKKRKKRFGF